MAKGPPIAVDERAKCAAPAKEFVSFAKRLLAPRAERRLQAMAASPLADVFARRLVKEALGGGAHAVTCIKLAALLGSEPSWTARLPAADAKGRLPAPDVVPARDLEAVGRGLLLISPERALPWIARACLLARGAAAPALETLLLAAVPGTRALSEALDQALGAFRDEGTDITEDMVGRCIGLLERGARQRRGPDAGDRPLVQLARLVTGADAGRLLSALLTTLLDGEPAAAEVRAGAIVPAEPPAPEGPPKAAAAPKDSRRPASSAIAEAAWSDADEALGRALQDMDFLGRSFERLELAAQGEAADRTRRARNAVNLVLQWVQQAARHRSVAILHKPGDLVPFDPAVHDLDGEAGIGELVRIIRPAVVRGSAPQQVVLLRAEAEPD